MPERDTTPTRIADEPKRVFVTGASGCVGHYLAECLIQETDYDLFFLVRNPAKLRVDCNARPGITVLEGDLHQIEQFGSFLKTIDYVIHTATAWGGAQEVFDINVVKTLRLFELLDPQRCEKIIYFSTASLLDRNNKLLPAAGQIGNDYMRTKYTCLSRLSSLPIASRITTVFPTMLFGGEGNKPYSHISAGIPEVLRWIGLIRFLKMDASFHFVHAQDVARIVTHLLSLPQTEHEQWLTLGSDRTSLNGCIEEICAYLGKRVYLRVDLTPALINLIIVLFRIQVGPWERFCLDYRHFTYKVVSPASFGLPTYCGSITDLLKIHRIPPARRLH
ncbi:NAD(P)-dependent oxidoreductase [Leptolyngbya sp. FACHB-261]|uniref:NAD-dependent epimerase/dehydratase family protein n=1 Tax=Leptolyngbya sp. FACHB-261 TaxID=2692806 RepID=UPI00168807A7|nr:NAD(P)-dependent oxidoreductase [Leptolyngbya sp. FACHB-261]MBD2101593.1 NAD(P)-dependent oxidoreductase [Leptolyngbya sp. FACHB-261]